MEGNQSAAFRPWADLPEPLAEVVLELLPLVDYLHFAAVCRRWQLIQMEHRGRHSPSPPPMHRPLPWFVPRHLYPRAMDMANSNNGGGGRGFLESYSPLANKHYRLPLPPGLRRSRDIYCLASCHGWLLMTSHEPHCRSSSLKSILTELLIFNPITCTTITLPPLSITSNYGHRGALSAPPTDPECTVLFMDGLNCIFLHRLSGGARGWARVGGCVSICDMLRHRLWREILLSQPCPEAVGIIDPLLPEPTMLFFDWDLGVPPLADPVLLDNSPLHRTQPCCLVENDGEVCIVKQLKLDLSTILEFRVFRADLSRKQWVRMETLGDRAIFVDCVAFAD